MRINYILAALSLVFLGFGAMVFLPALVALYYQDFNSIPPFVTASFISILLGFLLKFITKEKQNFNDLRKKEGLFIVALTWISISFVAAIPFLFYGISPINAIFEGVSGITTTGATIFTNFDAYPKTLFFWRSFSQWLGGMGVIVLFIAILPQFAVAGRQMFFAEAPGPTEDKITPRIKQTAVALWGIYLALTILEIIILIWQGMPIFESICNSFATISAGGLSPHALSIAGYNNNIIWIVTIFMFLAGVNFALQYRVVVQRQFKALINSTEFLTYTFIFLGVSALVALALILHNNYGIFNAIRDAMFQVISIMTSTGFASVDFNEWSNSAKVLLFALMLIGGSAGSASGGIKVVRVIIVMKYLWREIVMILHPKTVMPVKLGKTTISDEILKQIIAFVIFYFILLIVSSIAVSLIEENLTIGIVGTAASLGNVGPGFAQIGPYGSFAELNPLTKLIFTFNMLVGRLELIPFLAMLHGDFWKFSFKKEQ